MRSTLKKMLYGTAAPIVCASMFGLPAQAQTVPVPPSTPAPGDQQPVGGGVADQRASAGIPNQPVATEAANAGDIGDIVVTAQKRSERLQDVPIAVTAIQGSALAAKGIASTMDVAIATPGLTYTQIAGASAPRIRGVGTTTALAGNENSVATYVDGVYYASSASSLLALDNVEQVAVLKGPQGTLFGRNATGGLIQITTLDPVRDFSGKASATYGNHDTYGGSLYVTGGLAQSLTGNLAVTYDDQSKGFGHDLTTGTELNKSRDLTTRAKLKLDLGDTMFKLTGDFAYLQSTNPSRRSTYGSKPTAQLPFAGGPFDSTANIDPYFRNRQGGGSLDITHHFDAFDVVSLTAYRKANTRVRFDVDGTALPLATVDNIYTDRQFSQELQIISKGGGPFSYTAGIFYFDFTGAYAHTVLNLPPFIQTFGSFQNTKSIAGYAQGTYHIDPRTSLTVGFRYSDETRRLHASGQVFTKATGITTTPAPIRGKFTIDRPTWRVSLDHHLDPNVLIYASYNRGFKSGGFNAATFFPAPEQFGPEKLDAYEAGVKSDLLGRRLRVNGSAFYYDYSNIQLTSFVSGITRITNAAKAKIYGLDVDVTAKPLNRLELSAGLSYIHSRFGDYPNAQLSVPLAAGGNLVTSGDATGNHLPYTPNWTADLGLDYDIPIATGALHFSTHYFHSNGWHPEPDNRLRQAPYNLLNASLLWKIGSAQRLSLQAWGRNLTNQVYAAQLQTQNFADVIVPAAGRTFGMTAGVKF